MNATKIFTIELNVAPEDIDELNHVNNVVYLKWINLAATKHWMQLTDNQFKEQYCWVALRHEIDYLKPAFLDDLITISTWIGATQGVKSIRHVEIFANNQLLTRAKTIWVLLDAKTMRPRRIQDDILKILKP